MSKKPLTNMENYAIIECAKQTMAVIQSLLHTSCRVKMFAASALFFRCIGIFQHFFGRLYSFADLQEFLSEIAQGIDRHAQERMNIMEEVHNPCENYCERVWKAVLQLSEK